MELTECRLCPRLVDWRQRVAVEKRAAFRDEVYWGRPVPSFGDFDAAILVVGLAPGAHGANRTGRMFTGDRSGDFLFASLHRTGFANQPSSDHAGDGLRLDGLLITAAVRCAPPDNKPTTQEVANCSRWLVPELARSDVRVLVALGGLAFGQILKHASAFGWDFASPRPRFGHGVEVHFADGPTLLASYHPSQQNTFTGRLTPEMLDAVWMRARELSAQPGHEVLDSFGEAAP